MLLDLRGLPLGQTAAGVRAQPVRVRAAAVVQRRGQVLLQVGLAQPLTGPVGQRGHPVRGQPEDGRHLGGGQPFHLGVPEHGLPALRQRGVRAGDDRLLQPLQSGVDERHPGVVRRQVVGDRDPAAGTGAVVRDPAQRREQVGPEGDVRAAAGLDHRQDLREGLRDEVFGLVRVAGHLPGQGAGRADVPQVQGTERSLVAGSDRRDQLRVAGTGRLGGPRLGLERGQVGHGLDSPSARALSIVDGEVTLRVHLVTIRPSPCTARGRPAASTQETPNWSAHDGPGGRLRGLREKHRQIPRHD